MHVRMYVCMYVCTYVCMYVFTANCMYVYIGDAGIRVCCTYTYYAFPKSAPNKHAAYSVREGVLSNGCVRIHESDAPNNQSRWYNTTTYVHAPRAVCLPLLPLSLAVLAPRLVQGYPVCGEGEDE